MAWRVLSNYGLVLLAISRHPDARTKDVAELVGITQRAAQRIIAELEADGCLTCARAGRRKRYVIDHDAVIRHALTNHRTLGELLAMFTPPAPVSLLEPMPTATGQSPAAIALPTLRIDDTPV